MTRDTEETERQSASEPPFANDRELVVPVAMSACSALLMDVINENFANPSSVIEWTLETIRELANVLKNGRGHLFVSPDVPEFLRQTEPSATLASVERGARSGRS